MERVLKCFMLLVQTVKRFLDGMEAYFALMPMQHVDVFNAAYEGCGSVLIYS